MTHRHEIDVNRQATETDSDSLGRRKFLRTSSLAAVAGAATFAWPRRSYAAAADLDAINAEITKRHDESVKRLADLDSPTFHRRGKSRHERRLRTHYEHASGSRFRPGNQSFDGWPTRHFRDTRRRCAANCRLVFHVRRKAGGPRGMVFSAVRCRCWWTSPVSAKPLLAAEQ